MKRSIIRSLSMCAAIAACLAIPRAVRAQAEIHLQTKPHEGASKEPGDDAPMVEATIINGATVEAGKLQLVQTDAKGPDGKTVPVAIKALPNGVKNYLQGPDTIAVVVLVEGHGLYMGVDNPDAGVFKQVGAAIDAVKDAGPPGSQGELIVYAGGTQVKLPMGDLKAISGGALGKLADYGAFTTRDLSAGIDQAYSDLKNAKTTRKCLIIIGDGGDTAAPDVAKGNLANQKKKFDTDKIEVHAVYYAVDDLEGDASVVKTIAPDVKIANSKENIAVQVGSIVSGLANRYYVTFPGYDPINKVGFTWDKGQHTFQLKIGDDAVDVTDPLTMNPEWHAPGPKKGLPWLWIILGTILGIVFIVLLVKVLGKKPVAAPPPMVVQQPMAPPPPGPPMPSGPAKTIMFNINQGDDGFPIVGWLVPLNGPNQFQTFKLGSSSVIGTGGGAHVVVNDGYMSTEHAMIVASPDGFILKDKGSTNGCLVNDRRVTDHPLIDNDVILMGKTNFKFKSTM